MPEPHSTHLGTGARQLPREGESLSPRAYKADYKIEDHGYETPCWQWQKYLSDRGYGHSTFTGHDQWAYRAYYVAAYGPIPEGYDVHHKCTNPACVNPEHLEAMHAREHDVQAFLTERANGLTLDDVKEIRRLGRIQGYRAKQVAEMFGIHWRTVDDYWGGRRWAAEFGDGPCRPVHTCPVCEEQYVAEKNRKQVYCSRSCQNRRNRARVAA